MRYIELNPVRAGLVARPADYRCSSYAANALGEDNWVISPHDEYVHLRQTPLQRRQLMRCWTHCKHPAPWEDLRGQIFLGQEGFVDEMRAVLTEATTVESEALREQG